MIKSVISQADSYKGNFGVFFFCSTLENSNGSMTFEHGL
jgi:hypothetical protein